MLVIGVSYTFAHTQRAIWSEFPLGFSKRILVLVVVSNMFVIFTPTWRNDPI